MKKQTQRPSISFADAVAQRHKAVEPGIVAGAFGVPGWVDCASGCLSRVQGYAQVTVGDIMVAASDLAARFNGEIVDFSVRSEGGARVYAFEIAFERDGEACLGTVGFSPIADGTVSVFAATCGADSALGFGPVYAHTEVAA